jgi:hypothetical protein
MNVRLHIGRVVLDGIDVAAGDRPRLKAAIESELARLVAERGLSAELARGGAFPSLRTAGMTVTPNATPSHLGVALAGAVADGVGGERR